MDEVVDDAELRHGVFGKNGVGDEWHFGGGGTRLGWGGWRQGGNVTKWKGI